MFSSQFTAVPSKQPYPQQQQPQQFFSSQVNGLMIPNCPTPSKQAVLQSQHQQSVIYRMNNASNNNNNTNIQMLTRSNPLAQPSVSQQPHYISQPTQHIPFNRFNQHQQQFNPQNDRFTLQQQQLPQQLSNINNIIPSQNNTNTNPFSVQQNPQYPLMRQSLQQQLLPNQQILQQQQQQQQQLLRNSSPIRNKPSQSQQQSNQTSTSNNNNGLLSLQQLSSTGLSTQVNQQKQLKSKEELITNGLKYSQQQQQQQQLPQPFMKNTKSQQESKTPQGQTIQQNAIQRENKTPVRLSQLQSIQQQLNKQGNNNNNTKLSVFPQISPQRTSPLQGVKDNTNPILDQQSSLLRQHSEGDFSYPRYAKSTEKTSKIFNQPAGISAANTNARETSLSFKQDKSPRLIGYATNNNNNSTAINSNKGQQMLRVESILLSQRTQAIAKTQQSMNMTSSQQQLQDSNTAIQQQGGFQQQHITKETEQSEQKEEKELLNEDKLKKRQHNGILLLGEGTNNSAKSTPQKVMSKTSDQIFKQPQQQQQQQQHQQLQQPHPTSPGSSSIIKGQQLFEGGQRKALGAFNISNREFFSSQTVLLGDKSFQDNSLQPVTGVLDTEEYQYSSVNSRKISLATQKVQNSIARIHQGNEKEVQIGSREYSATRGNVIATGAVADSSKDAINKSLNSNTIMQVKQNTISNGMIQIIGNSLNASEAKVNNMHLSSSDQEEYEYRTTGDWDKKNISRRENEEKEGKEQLNMEKNRINEINKVTEDDAERGHIIDQSQLQELRNSSLNGLKVQQQFNEESEQPQVYELADDQSKYFLDKLKDQEINENYKTNNDNISKLHEYSLRDDIIIPQEYDQVDIIQNIITPVSHIQIDYLTEYNQLLQAQQ